MLRQIVLTAERTVTRAGDNKAVLTAELRLENAPLQARENVGIAVAHGRMLSSVRPWMRQKTAAGLYGSSRTGSRSP